MTAAVGSGDWTLFRRLFRQARPCWLYVVTSLLVSLLSGPLALLAPLPLKIAVDSVVGARPLPGFFTAVLPRAVTGSEAALLAMAAGLVLAIALLNQVQALAASLLQAYTGEKLTLALRARLFHHVQRLSVSYHDVKGTSDSLYRIQYDAPSIQHLVTDGLIPSLTSAFSVAGMIYVTAWIDWQLAAVALTVSPVFFCISRAYRRRLRRQSGEVRNMESFAMSVAQEVLSTLRVVKAFGQEDREERRFIFHSGKATRARFRLASSEGGYALLLGVLTALGTAAVLLIGIGHVRSGALTLGELLLVMGYLTQIYVPLKTMGRKAGSLQSHLAGAERALSVLDEALDVAERPKARFLSRARGAVSFRDVSFTYADQRPVLLNISFEISPGTRVGIIGTTGAGKTTLINLLVRFYDPSAGEILLDGFNLREYRLADLRNQFAIVLQEPVLFSTTLAENIAYARPDATHGEIVAAARAANAHDFIASLPQGYDTRVGERGMRLSGGERQRIALARAFLKDAPVLILDEPTSSVDMKTETALLEAMERLVRGRTTFIITHRPSALEHCDAIMRIEQGRLVAIEPASSSTPRKVFADGERWLQALKTAATSAGSRADV